MGINASVRAISQCHPLRRHNFVHNHHMLIGINVLHGLSCNNLVIPQGFYCNNLVIPQVLYCNNLVIPQGLYCNNLVIPQGLYCNNLVNPPGSVYWT
jgi:hypothetical protein